MSDLQKIIDQMQTQASNVRFNDALKVCEHFFGKPRKTSGSHIVFKTPWYGDPRINLQPKNGKAKAYQIRQVILAIDRLNLLKK